MSLKIENQDNLNKFKLDKNIFKLLIEYINSKPELKNKFKKNSDGSFNISSDELLQILNDIEIILNKIINRCITYEKDKRF